MRRFALVMFVASLSVFGAHARSIVTTQQSVSYDLPEGWTVDRWTGKTGEAILKNTKSGDTIQVERYGVLTETQSYAHVEKIGDDRRLSWEYADDPLSPGNVTLKAQVTFTDPSVAARISIGAVTLESKGIDKENDLAAVRAIAGSVNVTGPRKCWPAGECPPGTIKEVK